MRVADAVQVVHVGAGLQPVHRAHGGQAQAAPPLELERCQLEARRGEGWKLGVSRIAFSSLLRFLAFFVSLGTIVMT